MERSEGCESQIERSKEHTIGRWCALAIVDRAAWKSR